MQHKQIRPSEQQHDRNHGPGGGYTDGYYASQHGGGYGGGRATLPPSGPMAAGWYHTTNVSAPIPQHDHVNPSVEGADPATATTPTSHNDPSKMGQDFTAAATATASSSDPLSTMEPLLQALPDVGCDAATSAVEGEN